MSIDQLMQTLGTKNMRSSGVGARLELSDIGAGEGVRIEAEM